MNVRPRPAAMERLFAAYLVVAGAALLFPHRPGWWPALLAVHLAAAWLALGAGPAGTAAAAARRRWPRAARLAGTLYPIALVPLLYTELEALNLAVHGGRFFDPLVQQWEAALFGGQPAVELARALPSRALSELLHGAYLSYYAIIYVPPIALYAAGRRQAAAALIFAVMLTFFAHYLFFIYFPVQGPRYLFPAPAGPAGDGPLAALTHRLLEAGSSRGAAFPSSHVGVSVAVTVMLARAAPRWAVAVGGATLGLALGAVYGGFHYAIDAIAGALLGLLLALVAPRLRRAAGG
jgi:membrane-associated phospholipid phosphatase